MQAPEPTGMIVVFVTVGALEEGEQIAEALVSERLAACVNVVGPVRSIYSWEGSLQRDEEYLLIIKTRETSFEPLASRVRELHAYATPEIIALPIHAGSEAYLAWVAGATDK